MTDTKTSQAAAAMPATAARNARQPIITLRDWLDHLAVRDRLAVIRPGTSLQFELAAGDPLTAEAHYYAAECSFQTGDPAAAVLAFEGPSPMERGCELVAFVDPSDD